MELSKVQTPEELQEALQLFLLRFHLWHQEMFGEPATSALAEAEAAALRKFEALPPRETFLVRYPSESAVLPKIAPARPKPWRRKPEEGERHEYDPNQRLYSKALKAGRQEVFDNPNRLLDSRMDPDKLRKLQLELNLLTISAAATGLAARLKELVER